MKRIGYGMLAFALALAIPSASRAYDPPAPLPGTGINDTVHDLGHAHNGMSFLAIPSDPLQRICIYCHAPHNTYRLFGTGIGAGPEAPVGYDYLPLWNHTYTSNAQSDFIMYDNGPGAPTDGAKASQAIQQFPPGPGSSSMLCLSCHDGSVAVNSYGNTDQLAESRSSGGASLGSFPAYVIGKDLYLGNHHPISFNYDDVVSADLRHSDGYAIRLRGVSTTGADAQKK